jgi:hypothetical protein
LQGIRPEKRNLLRYYRDTKEVLSIVRGLLDYEGDDSGCVYSLILRLRGLYLIRCGLRGERYSTEGLEGYARRKGIPRNVFREMYSVYRARRDDKPVKTKISKENVEKLHKMVSDLLCELENAE